MKKIKINFTDFWGDFNPLSNFIIESLSELYEIEISNTPDYLFFSTFGYNHLNYDCIKIMFVGENLVPDFNICDYALGFDHMHFGDRYMRLPLYLVSDNFTNFPKVKSFNADEVLSRRFCSIVVSNAKVASPMRERFFRLLSEYKHVDSGGRLWNNVGGAVCDKIDFIKKYKFNIAFENSSVLGYTTEKIMDPMTVNVLPIYWGNRLIGEDFNTSSFINVNDFDSLEAAVQCVVDLDNDDTKYLSVLQQPWISDPNVFEWKARLSEFLVNIISKNKEDAKYLSKYGMQKLYTQDLRIADFFGNRLKVKRLLGIYNSIKKME